jgi:hypothetical protein
MYEITLGGNIGYHDGYIIAPEKDIVIVCTYYPSLRVRLVWPSGIKWPMQDVTSDLLKALPQSAEINIGIRIAETGFDKK